MDDVEPSSREGVSTGFVVMAAFGFVVLLFALIPQTRPLVFLLLSVAGPGVAFGTLAQVFRGKIGLQSAAGIVFALVCGVLAFVTIPLGYLVVEETLGRALQFFGFGAAVVAIGFARLSVYDEPTATDRQLPPIETDQERSPADDRLPGDEGR